MFPLPLLAAIAAQCPTLDPGFAREVLDARARALATFDAGTGPRLHFGGDFTHAGALAANRIAAWDGVAWSALGGGLDGSVRALVVHDDGSGSALYAAGDFLQAGGQPALRIARWDGAAWSAVGAGLDGSVHALGVFDEGQGPRLFAAGEFASSGGTPVAHVARWDGATWSDVGAGVAGTVTSGEALHVHDDGTGPALWLGGAFTQVGGQSASNLARWNGTAWSAVGGGTSGPVQALATLTPALGGGLAAGGFFAQAGGVAAANVARWDGAAWSALGNGLGGGGGVHALAVAGNGLVAGGSFPPAFPMNSRNVGLWNGSTWASLELGLATTNFGGSVDALLEHDPQDGLGPRVIAGGDFTWSIVGGRVVAYAAQLLSGIWTAVVAGQGLDHESSSATAHQGALVVTGDFGSGGPTPVWRVAAFDGARWSALGFAPGVNGGPEVVRSLDLGAGPELYLGTTTNAVNANVRAPVFRWTGSAWQLLAATTYSMGVNNQVVDLAVFDEGAGPRLFACGSGLSEGQVFPLQAVLRWDGAAWSRLGPGATGIAYALAVHDNGSGPALYVARDGVHRWNGTAWTDLGLPGPVYSLASFDDGSGARLYASGSFATAGGASAYGLARWDGVAWSPLPGVTGWGFSGPLAVFDDRSGAGPRLWSVAALALRAFDGVSWSTVVATPAGNGVQRVATTTGIPGGDALVLLGSMTDLGGVRCSKLALLRACPPIDSFCAGDGTGPVPCPCGNSGLAGRGCENASLTGGALLVAGGGTQPDTLVLTASGERPNALSIFLQGDQELAQAVPFGDGLRCIDGSLKRLYTKSAVGGIVTAPSPGDPTISQRSAALGDPIAPGSVRAYQVYYRDPNPFHCPAPAGSTSNVSSGVRVTW